MQLAALQQASGTNEAAERHAAAASAASGPASALSLRAVSKTYEVDRQPLTVLRSISFDVAVGEFVSIVGASGCGKSTILRLIVGLEADYEGEIAFFGHQDRADVIPGIVFQDHRLYPWLTVAQNVGLGLEGKKGDKSRRREDVARYLDLVGLTGFEAAYPHQLSGGMAQRAAIARALVTRPTILLLDEPLGALDALTRTYLQDELLRILREEKLSVVMVTHDVEEAVYLSSRVIIMEPRPGRIKRVVPIDREQALQRSSPAFGALKASILADLSR